MNKISKEQLEELYLQRKMSIKEISAATKISVGCIFNYLKRYEIPTRIRMTDETKRKISIAKIGRVSARKGHHLSIETKKKISKANKGRLRCPSEYGGHRNKRSDGYVKVYVPDHPYATKDGYVMEHILVMERAIGRYIKRDEVVHHKNHIRDDNRISNLQLMTFKEHCSMHSRERWAKKKGVLTYQ